MFAQRTNRDIFRLTWLVLVSEGIVEERDARFRAVSNQLDFFGLQGLGAANLPNLERLIQGLFRFFMKGHV
jgi:hypothetical protein